MLPYACRHVNSAIAKFARLMLMRVILIIMMSMISLEDAQRMTSETRLTEVKGSEAKIPPEISSQSLFAGRREIIIEHGVERYRLCITANNKLILLK